ncbi:phosphoesterase [Vibrio ponticus]|uniref:Phosphatase PAP2 family protein n=1 Tax=Vibrio ponticus TaxID=265668 RepID=A0A3N3DTW6_9VIBR|nr:phosphatase PAP2 family protein [Vibrio ponticus]OLQ85522.1 phosphoesterase [Vibrio ponticus]ROV57648.1 phosphatase PAP2 family protein [Vibrio ponticus]
MKHKFIAPLFAVSALWSSHSLALEGQELETTGDILQWAIPATAGVISLAKFDGEGFGQLVEGAFLTASATHILKVAINAERPNGGDYSMPSGHTSAAMQGAAYLQFRYGWKYGVPAYLAAGVVGYSRVDRNYHYWRDVAAGTLLATAIQYSVTKAGFSVTNFAVAPTFDGERVGILANIKF